MSLEDVDPELRAMIAEWPGFDFTAVPLDVIRNAPQRFAPMEPPAPQPVEHILPGRGGNPDVRVLVVDPSPGAQDRPVLLHIHGGGYVIGSADSSVATVQSMAMKCGIPIVTVDYRLAPETRFPGSLEDNYAALCWLAGEGADELGVDPARIAIGGESAGGGHSAMLAIAARDRGGPAIAFQMLVYPMLDDRAGSTVDLPAHIGRHIWQSAHNRFGWEALTGVPAGVGEPPYGSVPARVADLSGLPPAWIGCGALDLFIDENLDYARRLIAAGVHTEVCVMPGAYHGFDGLVPKAAVSRKFTASKIEALKRCLGLSI